METKKDIYKTSRVLYVIEALAEYLSSLLVTSTFLAAISKEIGLSDAWTGIVATFTSLGCGFQMLSLFINRKNGVKKVVILGAILNELLFVFVYMLPLVELSSTVKAALFVICMMSGNVILRTIYAPKISWYMALVDDAKRGIFTSIKEMISLAGGLVFSLSMGYLSDRMKEAGNQRGFFIVGGLTLLGLMILHLSTMIFSKEKPATEADGEKVGKRLKSLIKIRGFRKAVAVCMIWNIANCIAVSFYGTYMLSELGFSLFYAQIMTSVYCVARVIASPFLGKFADRYSFAKLMVLCLSFAAASRICVCFTSAENGKWLFALYEILLGIAGAGINSSLVNLVFDYTPAHLRSDALALENTLYGFGGFFASLLAGLVVTAIQEGGNQVFGLSIYAQQLLSAVSAAILIGLAVYVALHLTKEKRV